MKLKNYNRKQEEGKIGVKQIKSALDVAQRYYRSSKECSSMYLLGKQCGDYSIAGRRKGGSES